MDIANASLTLEESAVLRNSVYIYQLNFCYNIFAIIPV